MSVINQMLKELEDRNDKNGSNTTAVGANQAEKKSSVFKLILIVAILLLINVLGLYIWDLYSENEALKKAVITPVPSPAKPSVQNQTIESKKSLTVSRNDEVNQPAIIEQVNDSPSSLLENKNTQTSAEITNNTQVNKQVKASENQQEVKNENVVVTPFESNNNIQQHTKVTEDKIEEPPVRKPSLSISRSQLSPGRAVQNKLQKAERAIIDNNVPKAEQLFEDILLIQPDHKGARKQLAALWFGRKLFRPALNLLSQGISIYPDDVDFRLMKARILLNQNNNEAAFYVLNEFSTAQHIEYQALLANTAQSVRELKSVVLAYQQLVKLDEHKGKWWMGLGVALDQSSQFEEAKIAYKMALSKGSLSNNSAQFIRQRMNELGE